MLEFLRNDNDLCIIQVGAHDGKANDPLNAIRQVPGCHGFAIEANPRVYPGLCETLKPFPSIVPLNIAISETSGTTTSIVYLTQVIQTSLAGRARCLR